MNTKIHAVYETGQSNDTVSAILNQLTFELDTGGWDTAKVILQIPNYLLFKPNGFNNNFRLGYYQNQQIKTLNTTNYLITETANIYNLTESPIKLMVATNKSFLAEENLWSGEEVREPAYYPCLPSQFLCNYCGTPNNQTNINHSSIFGQTFSQELYITTGLNTNSILDDACYDNSFEAILGAIKSNYLQTYNRINSFQGNPVVLEKIKHPIGISNSGKLSKKVNKMSLCELYTGFNTVDEIPSTSINSNHVAFGSIIFYLTRPKTFQNTLYFIAPLMRGLTYANDPDILFSFSLTDHNCFNGSLDEEYEFGGLDVKTTFDNNFINPNYNFLGSTDFTTINSLIYDNKVILNFSKSQGGSKGNILEFVASNSEPGCSPSTGSIYIGSAILYPNGKYEIEFNHLFQAGSEIEVKATINFQNGEKINNCQKIILNTNHPNYDKCNIATFGKPLDYNSSISNYEIKFYQL